MPIPQESVNVQNDTNGKLPDEGLDAIKRDIAALCRLAKVASINVLCGTRISRPPAASSNNGTLYVTTEPGLRALYLSNGMYWILVAEQHSDKTITYNVDGTVNVISSPSGTKTMSYNVDGTLASVSGTGDYRSKTLTYNAGQLTTIAYS